MHMPDTMVSSVQARQLADWQKRKSFSLMVFIIMALSG
jgi:hypothetical protein